MSNNILLVLGGGFDNSFQTGYAVIALEFEESTIKHYEVIAPSSEHTSREGEIAFGLGINTLESAEIVNRQGAGFWPHRPLDVAVNSRGWIIISVAGEGLYALSPSPLTAQICDLGVREC